MLAESSTDPPTEPTNLPPAVLAAAVSLRESGFPLHALLKLRRIDLLKCPELRDRVALEQGRAAARIRSFAEAEALLRGVIERGASAPAVTESRVALAESYLLAERPAEAAGELDATRMEPDARPADLVARASLARASVLRLRGEPDPARDALAAARRAAGPAPSAALEVALQDEAAMQAWAAGDLAAAASGLDAALARATAAAAPHLVGEAALRCGQLAGAVGREAARLAGLAEPAARYLARAQEAFQQAASLLDLERVRRAFRAHGRRATDRVADARLAERVDAAHTGLEDILTAADASAVADPGVHEAVGREFRLIDQLGTAALAVAVERESLRRVLEGLQRLATLGDGVELAQEVTRLVADVLDVDCAILALVSRGGELLEREAVGHEGASLAWRPLAEAAWRTGRPAEEPAGPGEGLPVALAVPVRRGDAVHGVLYADRRRRGGVLPAEARRLLETLAIQAGALLERQRMHWALQMAARTREATLEAITDGVLALAADGRVRQASAAAARALGRTRAEVEGRPVGELPGLAGLGASPADLAGAEGRLVRLPEGEAVLGTRLLVDEEGQPAGAVLTFTGLRRLQRTVQRIIGSGARFRFEDIIGDFPAFRAQLDLARAAARTDAGVLVTGESGTGKEVVAQAIHAASARAAGPFVGINCAAIPRELLESELFGYEEGAFTGARRGGHAGKLELTAGGTLLLDEIGDMPLDMQAKLLRVLQERRFQRVGGSRDHVLEARVIATTNRNLDALASIGRFRQDLFYRLKVIHIHLPPLRERPEDIPRLLDRFLERAVARMGRGPLRVAPAVREASLRYAWPGNVRELEYVVESEVSLAPPEAEVLERVPPSLEPGRRRRDTMVAIRTPLLPSGPEPAPGPAASRTDRDALVGALERHAGNVRAAARELGISRPTCYAWCLRHGLDPAAFRRG